MIYTKYKHILNKALIIVSTIFFSYGQSIQEISKLREEYEKFKKGKTNINEVNQTNSQLESDNSMKKSITPFNADKFSSIRDSLSSINMHYGYNFFNRSDTLSFWENLPVPPDYIIGPGDELIISLWGATQLKIEYLVDRNGKIYDEKVGMLFLSGKTINQAQDYLLKEFSRVYATLGSNNPTTFLDVSLGELKSINVNFVGELLHPGLYPLHPFSNLITGLIQVGGIDTTGTLRNISIKRSNKKSTNIDLYDYLLNGNAPKDIQLKDQDIVYIPTRMSKVYLCSSVVRPGIYEAKTNESIKDLISFSGGITANASNIIGVSRIVPLSKRKNKPYLNENYYIDYYNSHLLNIEDGDTITVKSIASSVNKVEIIGQVKKPGSYYFKQGMTIKELIELSGGLSDSTFWKTVYQKKAEIIRRNPNNPYEKVISVNLSSLLNDKSKDILLQNLDRFVIHANPNFFKKSNVQIVGEINIPGSYPIIKSGETLTSLINRSGGLTENALDEGISIFRNKKYFYKEIKIRNNYQFLNDNSQNTEQNEYEKIVKNEYINNIENENKEKWVKVAWKNKNIALMPGDSIVVRQSTGTVNVYGEVYNPGLIEFQKGQSLKYYLDNAGGPTINGSSKNIIVIYANGVVAPNKLFSSPKIKDGSTIVVNKKEYKEPFKLAEFTSSVLSIISTTVTILVLSQQLSNN